MGGPLKRLTFAIDGLACGGALSAEQAIARLPGVIRAYVNPLTEMAYVEVDPSTVSEEQIVAVVANLGLRPGQPAAR
jgi:copper chaperone CopZ